MSASAIVIEQGQPTPGDWEARPWFGPRAAGATTVGVPDAALVMGFRVIADCGRPEDAALCAAAPKMRAALVVIKRNLDLAPRGNTHIDALRDLVDSALAKGMPK